MEKAMISQAIDDKATELLKEVTAGTWAESIIDQTVECKIAFLAALACGANDENIKGFVKYAMARI